MTTIKAIIETLEKDLAEFDAKVLACDIEYAKASYERMIKAKEEYAHLRNDGWSYYPKIFAAAGGKTMYDIIQYGVNSLVINFLEKNNKAKAKKRNFKIAKKLNDLQVTSVSSAEVKYSHNGFNGTFSLQTESGEKYVTIDTIYAGGYNVQRAHLRVLVKVK